VRPLAIVLTLALTVVAAEAPSFTPQQKRWWAIQPLVKPPVPEVRNASWAANEIDRFLLAKLEAKKLMPNPEADRHTLIRRVSLDLTGLPPTAAEVQAFVEDNSPQAWERVVDRLLASPAYGERWARHWLDVARYADSDGFKADDTRPHVWRYRDWVIESLNADKPFSRFVKEQIAGDELYPGEMAARVAVGFNRHFPDEYNAAHIRLRRQEMLNDITDATAYAFLGVTVACARCHDHKFDPILHKDYYRLQAFFANTRIDDDVELDNAGEKARYQAAYAKWDAATKPIRDEMQALLKPIRDVRSKERHERFPEDIQAILAKKFEDLNPEEQMLYRKAYPQVIFTDGELVNGLKGEKAARYRELKAQLASFDSMKPAPPKLAQTLVDESNRAPKTYVLRGGAWDGQMEEVEPGFLSILDPAPAKVTPLDKSTGRRSALAEWIASPTNPLSNRVFVNRVWHYHFGQGLVATPNDFGVMGARPSHRELLDWLTVTFAQEDGGSIKKLHKRILMTAAYRQTSLSRPDGEQADPENKLLWKFARRRLEAEAVRDSMLQVSGLLNPKMGGPGLFPPLPDGALPKGYKLWNVDGDEPEHFRRSVYIFVRRNLRYPMFQSFDMPDTHESCARRQTSVTPDQALELMNGKLVAVYAKGFAEKVANDRGLDLRGQAERALRLAYARPIQADEVTAAAAFLEKQERIAGSKEAALIDLCHTLLSSNEFLYLQ
jgi:hypothetical protein